MKQWISYTIHMILEDSYYISRLFSTFLASVLDFLFVNHFTPENREHFVTMKLSDWETCVKYS